MSYIPYSPQHAAHINHILSQGFAVGGIDGLYVAEVNPNNVRCVLPFQAHHLRLGNTISGPTMMALADAAMYVILLSLDEKNINSVTRDFQIHFLSRPAAQDLVAVAHLIKDSKKYTLMRVDIFSNDKLVAHVTGSYVKGAYT